MTPAKPAPPPGDVADAINALTTFLRNGSQTHDPEAFNPRQRGTQLQVPAPACSWIRCCPTGTCNWVPRCRRGPTASSAADGGAGRSGR